jgi:hypothetical protein
MNRINIGKLGFVFFGLLLSMELGSCKKYLAASTSKSLVAITNVGDLQALLDAYYNMNTICAEASDEAADDYFLTDSTLQALGSPSGQQVYLWQPGMFDDESPTDADWQNEYSVVYNANLVLDNIGSLARTSENASNLDYCHGEALVFRAKSFLEIAAIWAKAYDSATAASTAGIPLRLTSDFNAPTTRATVAQTFQQILSDLQASIPLLPNAPVFIFRPSKGAAYGLLARTYLAMRNYPKAAVYADSALQLDSALVDFNTLSSSPGSYAFAAIPYTNPEEIMYSSVTLDNENLYLGYMFVDTTLYASYDNNDLRKIIYFAPSVDGYYYYQGGYTGNYVDYNGLATDEMYLIRAEGAARAGNVAGAMASLNSLLSRRWVTGTFTPFGAPAADSALSLVLKERRKELVFRSTRWTDIKRLNLDGANISLTRIIGGQTYTLPANDARFAMPIPTKVIQLSGISQN